MPDWIENAYGVWPPLPENVNELFAANVFVVGEIVNTDTTVTEALEILANESENHRYDEKCDIFSIGVVFHIL